MANKNTQGHCEIPLCRTAPKFLYSNSRSHAWPFGAIAELIDNAYDPDVNASSIYIDYEKISGMPCLTFSDDGNGLDIKKMHDMLSFGFSEKEEKDGKPPIGRYGNGFKSGSMRLGKDAVVFSKIEDKLVVGFLSQTYLEEIEAVDIKLPIVEFSDKSKDHELSLTDLKKYSIFDSDMALKEQFNKITTTKGTRIVIYNLSQEKSSNGQQEYELDCQKDPTDILLAGGADWRKRSVRLMNKYRQEPISEEETKCLYSLKAYCEILYLHPKIKIYLKKKEVNPISFAQSLRETKKDSYKPQGGNKVVITFGVNPKKFPYGVCFYHNNRVIKFYQRLGMQSNSTKVQADNRGSGVVGVIDCNFLEPTQIKQDFTQDAAYNRCVKAVADKLNNYCKTRKIGKETLHSTLGRKSDKNSDIEDPQASDDKARPKKPKTQEVKYRDTEDPQASADKPRPTYEEQKRKSDSEETQTSDDKPIPPYKKQRVNRKPETRKDSRASGDQEEKFRRKFQRVERTPVNPELYDKNQIEPKSSGLSEGPEDSDDEARSENFMPCEVMEIPEEIKARGEEALKVFNEELEKGVITVNHARLMVTGKAGVGKTCLVNTLLGNPFIEDEPSTDGIVLTTAFQTTGIDGSEWNEQKDMDDCKWIQQLYDDTLACNVAKELKKKEAQEASSLPETTSELRPEAVPGQAPGLAPKMAPASVLEPVCEPISKPVHEQFPKPTPQTTPNRGAESVRLNAMSRGPPVENIEEVKGINQKTEIPIETQKKIVDTMTGKTAGVTENKDITYIWDFAGQQLYYITHRIFLTREAVYLILFNLVESLKAKGKCRVSRMANNEMTYDMTNLQIVKYWMKLIYTYAVPVKSHQQGRIKKPQIAVVGTHCASLIGTENDKQRMIEEQFKTIFEEIKGTPYESHVIRKIFFIDNKYPSERNKLKTLKQVVGKCLKQMPKTIPLKWLNFQHQLQEIGKQAMRMTYAEVCEVAINCGISVRNLVHTLNYLHDLGIILYFENHKLLKDSVITNPQMLIDVLKKVITVVEPDHDDKWPSMIQLWNKLDDEGILEEKLVRHLWRVELEQDEANLEVFLELMKQFHLLCEIKKSEESTDRSFFVPCRLKRSEDSVAIMPDTDQMVSIYMSSEDFHADCIFYPLVVSLIEMGQRKKDCRVKPQLFSNKATIGLRNDHILNLRQVVINNKTSLKLEISRMPEVEEDRTVKIGEPFPRVCMEVLEFLKQELRVLTSGMKHTDYKFQVLCWFSEELHFHNLEECLENTCIPCGGKNLKTTKLQRMFKNMEQETGLSEEAEILHDTVRSSGILQTEQQVVIADGIEVQWKELGIRLGLEWNKLNQIHTNHGRTSDCTFAMLELWKQNGSNTNQVEIIVKALKDQRRTDLAKKVLQISKTQLPSYPTTHAVTNGQLHQTDKGGCLKDLDLLVIASLLNRDWTYCGFSLDMKLSTIRSIECDFPQSIVHASMEMLTKWRNMQKSNVNQLEVMRRALTRVEREDINIELWKHLNIKS